MAQYSPFDPLCWLIFAVFLVSMFLIVKLFHHRYPGYPDRADTKQEPVYRVAAETRQEGEVSVETP